MAGEMVRTEMLGMRFEHYKLTCKDLSNRQVCQPCQNYSVIVTYWAGHGDIWRFVDANGCISTFSGEKVESDYHWSASVGYNFATEGGCGPIVEGSRTTDGPTPTTIIGAAGHCVGDNGFIQVDSA